MSDGRYCVRCRHVSHGVNGEDKSLHPVYYCKAKEMIDPVTGGLSDGFCVVVRLNVNFCGPDGKWFEPWGES